MPDENILAAAVGVVEYVVLVHRGCDYSVLDCVLPLQLVFPNEMEARTWCTRRC